MLGLDELYDTDADADANDDDDDNDDYGRCSEGWNCILCYIYIVI